LHSSPRGNIQNVQLGNINPSPLLPYEPGTPGQATPRALEPTESGLCYHYLIRQTVKGIIQHQQWLKSWAGSRDLSPHAPRAAQGGCTRTLSRTGARKRRAWQASRHVRYKGALETQMTRSSACKHLQLHGSDTETVRSGRVSTAKLGSGTFFIRFFQHMVGACLLFPGELYILDI